MAVRGTGMKFTQATCEILASNQQYIYQQAPRQRFNMKKLFYIDYPQESYEGQMHRYRCAFCKVETTTINGNLEGHLPSCEYRIKMEKQGYDCEGSCAEPASHDTDDFD